MFLFGLALALLGTTNGYQRILGGKDVHIQHFNFQVSVQIITQHMCGGALIKSDTVLTTASCFHDFSITPEMVAVRAGNTKLYHGIRNWVAQINTHPRFKPGERDYDIAILILKESYTLSANIQCVKLIEKNYKFKPGTESYVTGWGITYKEKSHDVLQMIRLPYFDWNTCKKKYEEVVTERMSCWGGAGDGKSACYGDFGGPVVISLNLEQVLVALSGEGIACDPEHPGFYTNIANAEIHDYINEYI